MPGFSSNLILKTAIRERALTIFQLFESLIDALQGGAHLGMNFLQQTAGGSLFLGLAQRRALSVGLNRAPRELGHRYLLRATHLAKPGNTLTGYQVLLAHQLGISSHNRYLGTVVKVMSIIPFPLHIHNRIHNEKCSLFQCIMPQYRECAVALL